MVKKSVLFICLGNICRSPMADAVFQHLLKERGLEANWTVDSAALGGWHVGNDPDHRCLKVLQVKGIKYEHPVRQISKDDFNRFDYIFGMDNDNIRALEAMAPKNKGNAYKGTIALLGSYDPEKELIIRDPYYDNDDKGFYKCYDQCLRSCTAFLEANSE